MDSLLQDTMNFSKNSVFYVFTATCISMYYWWLSL